MTFTTSAYWICRQIVEVELGEAKPTKECRAMSLQFVTLLEIRSVARISEFLDLPQEDGTTQSSHPPAAWPTSGADDLVTIDGIDVRRGAETQRVSLNLKARQRVALVGRIGSGKSTLAASLLRSVEALAGNVTIDGINIASISVGDLRTRVVSARLHGLTLR